MNSRFCFPSHAAYALLAALLAAVTAAVCAKESAEQENVRAAVEAGRYRPLASILAQVERNWPGARVLEMDTKQGVLGQMYYEVKLLDRAGIKRTLLVDAATGRELAEGNTLGQAVTLRALAAYLRRIEAESGQRVVEAEFELGIDGQPTYQLLLMPAVASAQRRLMDAASGQLVELPARDDGALRTMPDMLEDLAARHEDATVLEVELEGVGGANVYYEVDLGLEGNRKLELHVDARTLRVLKSRYKSN